MRPSSYHITPPSSVALCTKPSLAEQLAKKASQYEKSLISIGNLANSKGWGSGPVPLKPITGRLISPKPRYDTLSPTKAKGLSRKVSLLYLPSNRDSATIEVANSLQMLAQSQFFTPTATPATIPLAPSPTVTPTLTPTLTPSSPPTSTPTQAHSQPPAQPVIMSPITLKPKAEKPENTELPEKSLSADLSDKVSSTEITDKRTCTELPELQLQISESPQIPTQPNPLGDNVPAPNSPILPPPSSPIQSPQIASPLNLSQHGSLDSESSSSSSSSPILCPPRALSPLPTTPSIVQESEDSSHTPPENADVDSNTTTASSDKSVEADHLEIEIPAIIQPPRLTRAGFTPTKGQEKLIKEAKARNLKLEHDLERAHLKDLENAAKVLEQKKADLVAKHKREEQAKLREQRKSVLTDSRKSEESNKPKEMEVLSALSAVHTEEMAKLDKSSAQESQRLKIVHLTKSCEINISFFNEMTILEQKLLQEQHLEAKARMQKQLESDMKLQRKEYSKKLKIIAKQREKTKNPMTEEELHKEEEKFAQELSEQQAEQFRKFEQDLAKQQKALETEQAEHRVELTKFFRDLLQPMVSDTSGN
ncbi:hypothetical protein Pelo_17901 [Pelomyxa schiedti]|nr:hypothetical protein Pelo_17901 [Pelomyxa schiedti]